MTQESVAPAENNENELVENARAIHQRILLLDSHVDFSPAHLVGAPNYSEHLDTQCNLPKMDQGGIDALFFVVYVGQTRETQNPDALKPPGYQRAYQAALDKFNAVHRFVSEIAPEKIALALTTAELRGIHAQRKKAAFIGVENGYPLAEDVSRVQEFYERGARYLSLTHNGHNQLSDSHTGEREGWKWQGLSPLGEEVVAAMNRVGMMIDVSHASKESMLQTALLSKAPIIASHSAVRALCNVSRNLDDEQLVRIKETGGVMQVVAYGGFIKTPKPDSPDRIAALAALRRQFNLPDPADPRQRASFHATVSQLPGDQRAAYDAKLSAINEQYPGDPPADVSDFVDHIDYAVNLLGIDHVGIASDFDGGGGVSGWQDASETFNVTLELVRRRYTEPQIAKLWGGNLMRVLEEVQRVGENR